MQVYLKINIQKLMCVRYLFAAKIICNNLYIQTKK